MTAIFILLLLFQIKHFLADYPLQRPWMLGKFKEKGWVLPLAAHCLVHAAFTLVIGLFCGWIPLWVVVCMAGFDFGAHFLMDRAKASKKLLGRFEPLNAYQYQAMVAVVKGDPIGGPYPVAEAKKRLSSNRWFWHSIGLDQLVHHLTHYVIILVFIVFLF